MSGTVILLYAAFGLPLLLTALSLLPGLRPLLLRSLPFAPLPALAAALALPANATVSLPEALLGARLALDLPGRIFLGISAAVWGLAGVQARAEIGGRNQGRFAGFWLATLTGNMLLFIAADVVTFYLAFAILSLAAFGLIVHNETAEAHRAGRIYLTLAVVGEVALLAGFMVAANAADGVAISAIRAALAQVAERDLAIALLVIGFGIKAGLVPLHFWLPLAHPAAPVPASAVLSGAIVKAGIFGLIQFLPWHAALSGWSDLLIAAGLITAYSGILLGIGQVRPKTVLAYSTLSQMGLAIVVLGSALGTAGGAELAIAAATLYAAHHGLAKAALFLSVGAVGASGGRLRKVLLGVTGMAALSIAGLPFTGGAVAKLGTKYPLDEGGVRLLVSLSAVGTTLLLARFLHLVGQGARTTKGTPAIARLAPTLACTAAALVLPWILFPTLVRRPLDYAVQPENLWSTLWPILVGLALLALTGRHLHKLAVPEGDVAAPVERAFGRTLAVLQPWWADTSPRTWAAPESIETALQRAEQHLSRLGAVGPLILVLAGAIFLCSGR